MTDLEVMSIVLWGICGLFTAIWTMKEEPDPIGLGMILIMLWVTAFGTLSLIIYGWKKHLNFME